MDSNIEHEICNNCKKEIPQQNYVMHTMHCARNITLCKQCNEPIPKAQYAEHEKSCRPPKPKKPSPPPIALEKSSYFQTRKAVEDKKIEARKERYMQRMDKLVDPGYSFRDNSQSTLSSVASSTSSTHDYSRENSYGYSSRLQNNSGISRSKENGFNFPVKSPEPERTKEPLVPPTPTVQPQGTTAYATQDKSSGMLACKYCDLELPKLELEDHENYCGSRTDKCMECGELVMFKDKQAHMASNHSSAARRNNIGRSARPLWDSDGQRSETASSEPSVRRPTPLGPLGTFDYDPMPYLPAAYQAPVAGGVKKKEGESYKEISRRLDCKTEYIRNLLHDSATITIPLRRNGITPRNHFNHNKANTPRKARKSKGRKDSKELIIPCEFCDVPVPHENLIEHQTGCRPDLARYLPHTNSSSEEDDSLAKSAEEFLNSPAPQPPAYRRRNPPTELIIPCEFCGVPVPHEDLIEHETGCRPDLARYTPRSRPRFSPERDDHLTAPSSPDVELPCEFCGDMIPASQLYSHQIRCN